MAARDAAWNGWKPLASKWVGQVIHARDSEMRLDRWLRQQFPFLPNSFFQSSIRKKRIRLLPKGVVAPDGIGINQLKQPLEQVPVANAAVNLQSASAKSILEPGTSVAIDSFLFQQLLQKQQAHDQYQLHLATRDDDAAQNTDIGRRFGHQQMKPQSRTFERMENDLLSRILFSNANYFVLDKPYGLAVQDGSKLTKSLANFLPSFQQHFGDDTLPHVVHRLDKDTSGALVLARNRLAAARFSHLLREGKVHKTYQALVVPKRHLETPVAPRGVIDLAIDGKPAHTKYRQLEEEDARGLWIQMKPLTGRKHQLRIHCSLGLQAPIFGDFRHGFRGRNSSKAPRLFLHANSIQFPDPLANNRIIRVKSALPHEMARQPIVEDSTNQHKAATNNRSPKPQGAGRPKASS